MTLPPIHGRDVFALQPIAAGERLIEYTRAVTTWRRAAARQRSQSGHTFVFGLSDGRVIDGSRGGNSARLINHACAPYCEAVETGDRVFIKLQPFLQRQITRIPSQTGCVHINLWMAREKL
jgi:SET domain-containing protein